MHCIMALLFAALIAMGVAQVEAGASLVQLDGREPRRFAATSSTKTMKIVDMIAAAVTTDAFGSFETSATATEGLEDPVYYTDTPPTSFTAQELTSSINSTRRRLAPITIRSQVVDLALTSSSSSARPISNTFHAQVVDLALTSSSEAPTSSCSKFSTTFSDKGDTTLSRSNTYTYTLSCGYTVKLSGWTHTRNYHKGFLLNQKGEGLAVVEGLEPGTEYSYLIYQYASSFAGVHEYKVNGRTRGETTSGATHEATGNGLAVADANGKVTFAFQRESSKSGGDHVALLPRE